MTVVATGSGRAGRTPRLRHRTSSVTPPVAGRKLGDMARAALSVIDKACRAAKAHVTALATAGEAESHLISLQPDATDMHSRPPSYAREIVSSASALDRPEHASIAGAGSARPQCRRCQSLGRRPGLGVGGPVCERCPRRCRRRDGALGNALQLDLLSTTHSASRQTDDDGTDARHAVATSRILTVRSQCATRRTYPRPLTPTRTDGER